MKWTKFCRRYALKAISGTKINLRERPDTNSESLLKLDEGTPVEILNKARQFDGEWLFIRTQSRIEGWIFGKYVQDRLGDKSEHGGKLKAVKGMDVNLRSEPNKSSNSLKKLYDGNIIEVISFSRQKDGQWYQVYTIDGTLGWIF